MSGYFLSFLIITAGIALAWALRKRHNAQSSESGLTVAKRFFGGWVVLVVAGVVAFAIFVLASDDRWTHQQAVLTSTSQSNARRHPSPRAADWRSTNRRESAESATGRPTA